VEEVNRAAEGIVNMVRELVTVAGKTDRPMTLVTVVTERRLRSDVEEAVASENPEARVVIEAIACESPELLAFSPTVDS